MRLVWVGLLATAVACGPRATTPTGPQPLPQPGPELGPEPSAPPDLFGRAWLEKVLPAFRERWTQSFLENARTLLAANHPLNDYKLACVLAFRVDGAGNVSELYAEQPSGNAEFDAAALEVVGESAPLPPPPEELRSDDGYVHLRWRFARDERREGLTGVTVERLEYELARALPELVAARRFPEAARRLAAAFGRGEAVNAHLRALAGNLVLDAIADHDVRTETRLAAAHAVIDLKWADGTKWIIENQISLPVEIQALLRPAAEAPAPAEVAKLTAVVADRSAARVTRSVAARALARSDTPEVRKALIDALGDREGTVRAAAADALAELGPGIKLFYKALPLLLDRDPEVRRAALVLVARVGGQRALGELSLRCRREKDRSVQRACARAFGEIADEGARTELVRLTKSTDADLARAAWIALAARRDPTAQSLVAARAQDADPIIRALAMAASEQPSPLIAGLRDADPQVRREALRSLLRRDRKQGIEQALSLLAASTIVEERWWVGAALLEAL